MKTEEEMVGMVIFYGFIILFFIFGVIVGYFIGG